MGGFALSLQPLLASWDALFIGKLLKQITVGIQLSKTALDAK